VIQALVTLNPKILDFYIRYVDQQLLREINIHDLNSFEIMYFFNPQAGSRATTLGNQNGIGSALYFTGTHMLNASRVRQLTRSKKTGKVHDRVGLQNQWVMRLNRNTLQPTDGSNDPLKVIPPLNKQRNIFTWVNTSNLTKKLTGHLLSYECWLYNNPPIIKPRSVITSNMNCADKQKAKRKQPQQNNDYHKQNSKRSKTESNPDTSSRQETVYKQSQKGISDHKRSHTQTDNSQERNSKCSKIL
jgi:hypothetical protein